MTQPEILERLVRQALGDAVFHRLVLQAELEALRAQGPTPTPQPDSNGTAGHVPTRPTA